MLCNAVIIMLVTFENHIKTDTIMCRNASVHTTALIRYRRPIYCSNEWILIYKIPLIWFCCKGILEASQKVYQINQLQLRVIIATLTHFKSLKLLQSIAIRQLLAKNIVIKKPTLLSCHCFIVDVCLQYIVFICYPLNVLYLIFCTDLCLFPILSHRGLSWFVQRKW